MNMKAWKSKLSSIVSNKTGGTPQGVSTAMDARLETGVELSAELRLRVGTACCKRSVNAACLDLHQFLNMMLMRKHLIRDFSGYVFLNLCLSTFCTLSFVVGYVKFT